MEIDETDQLEPIVDIDPPFDVEVDEQPLLSLCVTTGSLGVSTIRVEGAVGSRHL